MTNPRPVYACTKESVMQDTDECKWKMNQPLLLLVPARRRVQRHLGHRRGCGSRRGRGWVISSIGEKSVSEELVSFLFLSGEEPELWRRSFWDY